MASARVETAFAWWVPELVETWNRIQNQKFGIRILRTWDEAVRIDRAIGNTLWEDAVRADMSKVWIAFKVLEGDTIPPRGEHNRRSVS